MNKIILTIIPQILGDWIPLGLTFESFDLASERSLMDGMAQKVYLRKQESLRGIRLSKRS